MRPARSICSTVAAMNDALNVAVIGAGPVGLSLALLLARQQQRVAVFDAKTPEQIARDPRTLALSHGSRELLEALGAWDAQRAVPITDIHISQQSRGLAALASTHLQARDHGVPALGYTMPYGALVQSLFARSEQYSRDIAFQHGMLVSEVKAAGAARVQLWGKRGAAQAEELLGDAFDLAVICEGGLFADQQAKPIHRDYAQTAFIAKVTAERFEPGHAFERFTPQGPLALLPLADGYAMVCCARAQPSEHDINAAFGGALGRLALASPLVSIPLGLNAERTLVRGRTVRIGNAAQTLHPVAGQGFNLGLRDAWTLASLLQRQGPDEALARFGRARLADRGAMIAATDALARIFTWNLPGASLARAAGLAALTALPPARQWLAQWMMRGIR
jgi:2-octaprenyl-6-methoxyphenol hydroxylase